MLPDKKIEQILTFLKKRKYFILTSLILLFWFILCLPDPLFETPYSTLVNSRDGKLMAAKIADDGQWRFPEIDSVPYKFKQCITYFEDQYFYYHPGVNLVSMVKAMVQNFKAGEIVRGGSTISLQVIRLSRKNKPRTYYEKIIEIILALRLEIRYTKDEILKMYCSQAPFGGNVVGLEAATWRYFKREPHLLSWGEAATLAVLPNAPSLIYPGKNQEVLINKRNRLLDKLVENSVIDSLTCELSKEEALPGKPKPLPRETPHLLDKLILEGNKGYRVNTTIDANIQGKANFLVDRFYRQYVNNEIYNAAILVVDVRTKQVLAYVGNTNSSFEETGKDVDMISAERSSGSILKPFLYAWMLKEGELLPQMLVPDIPTQISGYSPKNFNESFDGAVYADNALARSLNIPAIRLLQEFGVEKFYSLINRSCISTIKKPASHYGLSIILGGAEVKLWEICQLYAGMSSSLNHFKQNSSQYFKNEYGALRFKQENHKPTNELANENLFSAGSIWCTFEALKEMDRPIEGTNWERYASSKKIAWKTGTSFGHKDAWAVGVTPEYVVGVWVGNADGEGRPGLTGAKYAAPLMFDMYKLLDKTSWWETPFDDLIKIPVCKQSGYKFSRFCNSPDSIWVPLNGVRVSECKFHQLVYLDSLKQYRVNSTCYPVSKMNIEKWFVLPPVMEWFYKKHNPYYKSIPPYLNNCYEKGADNLGIIYPDANAVLFVPRDFDESYQNVVFEAVHRIPNTELFWFIDNEMISKTKSKHEVNAILLEGKHKLTVVSEYGEEIVRFFEVIKK